MAGPGRSVKSKPWVYKYSNFLIYTNICTTTDQPSLCATSFRDEELVGLGLTVLSCKPRKSSHFYWF